VLGVVEAEMMELLMEQVLRKWRPLFGFEAGFEVVEYKNVVDGKGVHEDVGYIYLMQIGGAFDEKEYENVVMIEFELDLAHETVDGANLIQHIQLMSVMGVKVAVMVNEIEVEQTCAVVVMKRFVVLLVVGVIELIVDFV
jgi:hypothetical protein